MHMLAKHASMFQGRALFLSLCRFLRRGRFITVTGQSPSLKDYKQGIWDNFEAFWPF